MVRGVAEPRKGVAVRVVQYRQKNKRVVSCLMRVYARIAVGRGSGRSRKHTDVDEEKAEEWDTTVMQ